MMFSSPSIWQWQVSLLCLSSLYLYIQDHESTTIHAILFESIDASPIHSAALHTFGAAGPQPLELMLMHGKDCASQSTLPQMIFVTPQPNLFWLLLCGGEVVCFELFFLRIRLLISPAFHHWSYHSRQVVWSWVLEVHQRVAVNPFPHKERVDSYLVVYSGFVYCCFVYSPTIILNSVRMLKSLVEQYRMQTITECSVKYLLQ